MKVIIASVGDIAPIQSSDSYIANLIVLIEGQSELMSVKVIVPKEKLPLINEGSVLDIVPTPKSTFSVRRYEASNGKSESIAQTIEKLLKGGAK